ncbi:hypothetical protein F7725_009790 [Dissostichus mawsoni]|uniref:Cationic amino acid transporter C-terminal domain-containing protein n=1 Tax=Dissostichus mawsoni TaxID=36200 RepID=A0A7J5XLQ4_DISMA|nr:hypothetical protein F7725_009790 [Dissostichus mawsoni]
MSELNVCFQTAVLVCVMSYLTTYHIYNILDLEGWILASLFVCLLIFSGCVFMVCRQPQTTKKVSFMVPLLPFLPIVSVFVNIYLMVQLSFLIYFGYGMWHSVERQRKLQGPSNSNNQEHKKAGGEKQAAGGKDQEGFICPEKTSQSSPRVPQSQAHSACEGSVSSLYQGQHDAELPHH